jgi:hypothetical protein
LFIGRFNAQQADKTIPQIDNLPPQLPCANGYTDQTVVCAVREFGFETSLMESRIPGAEGNKEFLPYARH